MPVSAVGCALLPAGQCETWFSDEQEPMSAFRWRPCITSPHSSLVLPFPAPVAVVGHPAAVRGW